jgi:hypothetical protein
MTRGGATFPPVLQDGIWTEVRSFSNFTAENDPHGDHGFSAFDLPGAGRIFWQIDYYNPSLNRHSENPADLAQTVRVLTVMLASEY